MNKLNSGFGWRVWMFFMSFWVGFCRLGGGFIATRQGREVLGCQKDGNPSYAGLKPYVEALQCKLSTALIVLLLCGFHAPVFAALTDGLVAYWSFDDCTARDNSGNGHDGVISGSLPCVSSKSGKAFYFDGTGSTIIVPNAQSLKIDNQITISALVSIDQDNPNDAQIVQKGQSGFIWDYGLGAYYSYPSYRSWEADWFSTDAQTLPSQYGQYHLLTAIVDESNQSNPISIYLDGIKVTGTILGNTWTSTNNSRYGFINQSDYPLVIGVGHPSVYYKGYIDELRIYNRALTPAEVTALYQQGTTPIITSITPNETVIGKPTVFEVRGQNLNPNMGFTVGDCQYSNVALAGGTPELQRFVCTQFGSAGKKRGLVKTAPGGTTLYGETDGFIITAVNSPTLNAPATLTGQIVIGDDPTQRNVDNKLANKIVLNGYDKTNSCLTDWTGKFSCQIPKGWSGVLVPEAKGVQFSPRSIAINNARSLSIINTGIIKGATDDAFPVQGVIPSDWVSLLGIPSWLVDMSSGETNDLNAFEGRFSLRSAKIARNQSTAIETIAYVSQTSYVSFARRVSSNVGHGVLNFYIDGVLKKSWSGNVSWAIEKFQIPATGILDTATLTMKHTFRWEYKKDSEVEAGKDAAWIDLVTYPTLVKTTATSQKPSELCQGISAATAKLMTIQKPSCQQLQTYRDWLKVVRPKRFVEEKLLTSALENIKWTDTSNAKVQRAINISGKVWSYVSPFKDAENVGKVAVELHTALWGDLTEYSFCKKIFNASDACNIINEDLATAAQVVLTTQAFASVGTKFAINKITIPIAIEKGIEDGLATLANVGFGIYLDGLTETVNEFNISDDFLDKYYKSGANLATLKTKYGVAANASLTALVDAVAKKKGYSNKWWGVEYNLTNVVDLVNAGMVQVKKVAPFRYIKDVSEAITSYLYLYESIPTRQTGSQ